MFLSTSSVAILAQGSTAPTFALTHPAQPRVLAILTLWERVAVSIWSDIKTKGYQAVLTTLYPNVGVRGDLRQAVVWPEVVSDSLGTPQSGVRDPTPLTDRTDGRRTDTVVCNAWRLLPYESLRRKPG